MTPTPAQSATIRVRITPTLEHEYATRLPDLFPLEKLNTGFVDLTFAEALALLEDAEYNSDSDSVDVGPYAMPLATFNAYRSLAKRLRAAIWGSK